MEIIYKSKEYSKHLISLSGKKIERKLTNDSAKNIRNCVELIEKATEMLNIPQEELIGGPGNLTIFVLYPLGHLLTINPRTFNVMEKISCKGKSFNEVKTELENMNISPLYHIAFHFGIERERGGWGRSVDFEREEEIKKPIEFLREMREKIPFTSIASTSGKDTIDFFKRRADQKGIFKHTKINIDIFDQISLEWQISLFYKPL